ncbi:hypothetical protein CSE_04760 [Caldisericum exile AZM16c01]|uniref:Uncharacterized protein n=1 Tax=Caldisericum exile (strain DSM 21853 / NBRC 104410 / AZM16c01) TaxID=511051 RepID=A0A7U6JGQ2_CALEA|nr:hypothetical protein CSE_04760 [Caldisericum exile AZM16c01]
MLPTDRRKISNYKKTLLSILNLENTLFHDKFSITIQSKSSLVLRDLDTLKQFKDITLGITITTLNEQISKIFKN